LNAVSIGANNVFVDGFTMQNSNTGAETSPYNSGYVIRNNIIRNNVIGVHINSDGASQSLVTRNKVLANNKGMDSPSPPAFSGGGIISFGGLSNASILGNFVGQQRGAATFFDRCDDSVNSNLTISSNTIQNSFFAVALAANNTGVTIQRNTIDDTMASNDLFAPPAILVGDTNTNVVIGGATDAAGNTVNNSPAVGIGVGNYGPDCTPGPLPPGGVSIAHNTVSKSGQTGIEVITSVPGRVSVNGNHLTNNGGDGIFFESDTAGNTITGNTVSGSGILDCEDDSTGGAGGSPYFTTQNSWTLNTGGTDDPDGICPPPT
jgi:parallel beta-helix repeat protein